MEQAIQTKQTSRLTNTERLMLALPVAASAFVGLFQLLLPGLLAITGTRLYIHRGEARRTPDTAKWVKWFVVIVTVLAAIVGLLPLLLPTLTAPFFHLQGTDVFIFRQAGAASLGYAVMGVYELRSLNWQEIRLPFVMALVFNGLAFIVSLIVIIIGTTTWLPY